MAGNTYAFQVIDPCIFTDPHVISNFKPPRVLHPHSGLNHNTFAYFGAKEPEQGRFEPVRSDELGLENSLSEQVPNNSRCAVPARLVATY
jgi:hypothetical protein